MIETSTILRCNICHIEHTVSAASKEELEEWLEEHEWLSFLQGSWVHVCPDCQAILKSVMTESQNDPQE